MRRLRNRAGLSLVEVTIMLLVLMLLAGVLAPSIMDFVRDAQWVKVKEDCEAIGISVARMMRDVPPCFRLVGTDACTVDNRVDLLWSDGTTAGAISPTSSASTNYTLAGGNATGPLNWDTNITAQDGSMEQHLVRNDLLGAVSRAQRAVPADDSDGPAAGHRLARRVPVGANRPRSLGRRLHGELGVPLDGHRCVLPRPRDATARAGTVTSSACLAGPTGSTRPTSADAWGRSQFGTCREGDDFTFVIQGGTR